MDYFGVRHLDHLIARQGFRKYSRALADLHQHLDVSMSDLPPSFDVLEAVGVMAFFEVSAKKIPSSSTNSSKHVCVQ
jgi:hypothetical protein